MAARRKRGEVRIGTSGYEYDHWKGVFYDEALPKKQWFGHYTQYFHTASPPCRRALTPKRLRGHGECWISKCVDGMPPELRLRHSSAPPARSRPALRRTPP